MQKQASAVSDMLQTSVDAYDSAAHRGVQGNIEIYATLPKKRGGKKPLVAGEKVVSSVSSVSSVEADKKAKDKKTEKVKEKKSGRPEDSDYSSDQSPPHKGGKNNENKESKDDKNVGKKQHKIRRKLMMGGLIRRKNRSMPDLREGTEDEKETFEEPETRSLSRPTTPSEKSLGGYLSEGHLEVPPNMERSKLMRKSFHGSGKCHKVPPPIPQRTSSQLSASTPVPPPVPQHR